MFLENRFVLPLVFPSKDAIRTGFRVENSSMATVRFDVGFWSASSPIVIESVGWKSFVRLVSNAESLFWSESSSSLAADSDRRFTSAIKVWRKRWMRLNRKSIDEKFTRRTSRFRLSLFNSGRIGNLTDAFDWERLGFSGAGRDSVSKFELSWISYY